MWMRMVVAMAILALSPRQVHAHARLVSPTPRTQVISSTGPCGGAARTGSPLVVQPGQMVDVTWEEVQDHTGYYRLLFSAANDTSFSVLLYNIADIAIPMGMTKNTYSATVQMPSTPCTACTLQLIFVTTGAAADYYSCADIQIAAAVTTTTVPSNGTTSTTTTTLPSDPCDALDAFARADCQLDRALLRPRCADPIAPPLEHAVTRALQKTKTLVDHARAGGTTRRVARLLRLADRKLAAVAARAQRLSGSARLAESCAFDVEALVAELRDTIAGLGA
jgi:hypothetical protein